MSYSNKETTDLNKETFEQAMNDLTDNIELYVTPYTCVVKKDGLLVELPVEEVIKESLEGWE